MTDPKERDEGGNEEARRRAATERGAMDPGLKEQFERRETIVGPEESALEPNDDALQHPHN